MNAPALHTQSAASATADARLNSPPEQEEWLGRLLPAASLGILFVALSAIASSTAGLFVRLLPLDSWTIAFWRSLFAALFLVIPLALERPKSSLVAMFRPSAVELTAAICQAISMAAFIAALQFTGVANVAVIYATTPIIIALLARKLLGEAMPMAALGGGLVAFAGTTIVVSGSGFSVDLIGNGLAIAMTLAMAAVSLLIRRYRDRSLLSSICLANLLVCLASFGFATPLPIGWQELGILLLFGLMQVALAYVLFAAGARLIQASTASLIGTIQAPLASLWVWLAFQETPSATTLVGGGFIMAGTLGYLVFMASRTSKGVQPT